MLIALLAVLGVDLAVVIVLLAAVLGRRRWVGHQDGAFRGVIRVAGGELDGLGPKWRKGYGRWVRDVLVWTKRPFLFRNELVPVDRLDAERPARAGEVKRLGDDPVVVALATGGGTIVQVAARHDDRDRLVGPYGKPVAGSEGERHAGATVDGPAS